MEKLELGDFCDVVYAYAINGTEARTILRNGMIDYIYDIQQQVEEDMSFAGFRKASLSMLDELDAFTAGDR